MSEITPEMVETVAEWVGSTRGLPSVAETLRRNGGALQAEIEARAAKEAAARAQEARDRDLGRRINAAIRSVAGGDWPHTASVKFVDLGRTAREVLTADGWAHSDDVKFLLTHENVVDVRTILSTIDSRRAYSLDLLHQVSAAAKRLKTIFGVCSGCIRDECQVCAPKSSETTC